MNGLLTVEEVVAILKVNRETVYRWLRSGELPSCKIGHCYRVKTKDLEEFLTPFNRGEIK